MMVSQQSGNATILKFLCDLPLFEGVSQPGLAAVARQSHLKQVPKGTYLFFQADPAHTVYLVRQGAVAMRLENPDGRELVINEMGPGDCFGELSILTGDPRSTSAETIVDSELLFIPHSTFQTVLETEPSFVLNLLKMNARRLQYSSKREEALAFHDAQQRLARQLLIQDKLAADQGYLTLSQEELAQRAGLTRQTTALILGRWRRRGWLLTGRGHLVVLNRRDLELLDAQSESNN